MSDTQYISEPTKANGGISRLAWALDGARAGYQIVQCRPFSKLPLREGWKDLASNDSDELRRQWRECPNANHAYQTGQRVGLLVIDADGKIGLANLALLEREHGPLPRTRRRCTPGGGEHFDFVYPFGRRIKNSVGKIAPRVDVRAGHSGAAGMAIGAGSVNRDGIMYVWAEGCGPDDLPIAELPLAWAQLLDDPPEPEPQQPRDYDVDDAQKMKRCRAYLKVLGPSISGSGGHNAILRAACECYRFGCDDAMALDLLAEFNLRSIPPWNETDLRRKLSEAKLLVGNNAGSRLAEGGGI